MINDHLDGKGIVDIHEECIDVIVTLCHDGGRVHCGDGIQECCVVGILTAGAYIQPHAIM